MTSGAARQRAELLAREFHEAYEELAPSFGYKTREASAVPWDQVPEENRLLMIAVAERVGGALSDRVEAAEKELEHLRFTHEGCIEIAADMERERDAETRRAVAAEKGRDEAWAAVNDQHAAYVGECGLRRAAEERVAELEKAARRCIDVVHDESVADYAACGRISVILGNALSSPASPNTEGDKSS